MDRMLDWVSGDVSWIFESATNDIYDNKQAIKHVYGLVDCLQSVVR